MRILIAILMLMSASILAFFFADGTENQVLLWRNRALAALLAIGAIGILIRIGYETTWTGFGEEDLPKAENGEVRPKKTLWDWLQLLIVPLMLGLLTVIFTWQQSLRQQELDLRQQEIESQRAQDEAFQAYLDQMNQLLLEEKLRKANADSEVRTLARARTLSLLEQLDADRKARVLRFLYEANLIDTPHPVISLTNADLRGVDLSLPFDLSPLPPSEKLPVNVTFEEVDLSGTFLLNANLSYAILSEADLRNATLNDARLLGTWLPSANLTNTFAVRTNLRGANLSRANLYGFRPFEADLRFADLSHATVKPLDVDEEKYLEKAEAKLEGATMPDGSIHD